MPASADRGRALPTSRSPAALSAELDPKLPGNAIIQDIELAKDADGKVRYVDVVRDLQAGRCMAKASGMLWHDVPNRGRRIPAFAPQERAFGDVVLASGWQGDNSRHRRRCGRRQASPACSFCARWPGWRAAVTGEVFARIGNRSGARLAAAAGAVFNPVPYEPL